MKRTYRFTSYTGIRGNITIDWEALTYKVETNKTDYAGNIKPNGEGFTFRYVDGNVALKLDNDKLLVMPNKLLKMDYECFQWNWRVGYREGDIDHILYENLQIVQGQEVERPF
ncbi:hypothetical protein EV207_101180 [Scopulibacillus darangshiensis]|uniref:Uncharacterized protein n=1 Tax=Scopulibacillus darangshiensis TaxID=442528 RepID=A0A4R2PB20_9BACL|nr:hypothetical protein [Scopulibacillus darangshiensis]TCP32202.1 hypothetical protein EV207_101180 [Scopulibacillus darangshiensis]